MVATRRKPLIVIVGETAAGKSELAMFLAKKFNGEIINADSWSVYRGFDIGTAKPSAEDKKLIRHHLLDIANPKEGFSAAIFKRKVLETIEGIESWGAVPILSGGSGLYIDSILYDYSFLPASPTSLRRKYDSMSIEELLDEIKTKKYDITEIDIRNKRRLIRLLENKGIRPNSKPLRPDTLILGVKVESQKLQENIEKRVDKMLKNGLEDEVGQLSKMYGWDIEPMKGIGYREFKKYFESTQKLSETRDLIITHSLQLARKQRIWFKRNNSIQWVNHRSEIIDIVTTYLNKFSE